MCGIAGIVRQNRRQRSEIGDQRSDHAVVERMVEALKHRGPDDRGISDFGSRNLNFEGNGKTGRMQQSDVSLGHTRLSIIDLSPAGHQPKTTKDGRYSIVYNGEIYNFRE